MGPAEGAQGRERERWCGLEQAHVFKGFVVDGVVFFRHANLKGYVPLLLRLRIHVANLRPFRITALKHVKILRPDEGQSVIEPLEGQIDEGTCGERGVVAIHHGGQLPLGGAHAEGGPPLQPGQGVEFCGDLSFKAVGHQQGFNITDEAQRAASIGDEARFVCGFDLVFEVLKTLSNALEQRFSRTALGLWNCAQDGVAACVEERFSARHRLAKGRPAFGAQIVTGEFQPMLQFADVVLIERKRVPKNRGRILHCIALGQGGP